MYPDSPFHRHSLWDCICLSSSSSLSSKVSCQGTSKSISMSNHDQQNRSMFWKGLQTKWWWSSFGKNDTTNHYGTRRGVINIQNNNFHHYRIMQLSRRMWLWSQSCNRWQTHQSCTWTRCHSTGTGCRHGTSYYHQTRTNTRTTIRRTRISAMWVLWVMFIGWCGRSYPVQAFGGMIFVVQPPYTRSPRGTTVVCSSSMEHAENEEEVFYDQELGEIVGEDAGGVWVEDLLWRVQRLRLEEQNTKRFLKAGPRFLPYEECRKWVQAWNRWDSEEDWNNWIAMGEKRNPYIPSEPDVYYGKLGDWISWEHFLGKDSI